MKEQTNTTDTHTMPNDTHMIITKTHNTFTYPNTDSIMAVWKYAALSQEEGQQSGGTGGLPETVQGTGGGGGPPPYTEDDIALKRRMPFCIGL